MYIIEKLNNDIKNILSELGFDEEVNVTLSNRPELGDYQYNGVMSIAGKNKINPIELANKIKDKLSLNQDYKNINIAGPGFINISFSDRVLIDYINIINKDFEKNIYKVNNKTIFLDYGGANVAKQLHVGHLRSANIGEALKRLLNKTGHKTISDVHLGDWGRPMGLVILGIKKRYPNLPYFNPNYEGEYPTSPVVTNDELSIIYPEMSLEAKNNEEVLKEAQEITLELQNGNKGYYALWKNFTNVSINYIKEMYGLFNTTFDLWEGESDAALITDELLDYLYSGNYIEKSDGAEVIFVNKEDDKKEIPPFMVKKSNGGIVYSTAELATIYSRMKRFKFDELWYLTDNRQELHFLQSFRAAYKTNIVPSSLPLIHMSFGTMNGPDGTPFKTRDGGVLSLKELYEMTYDECYSKLSDEIANKDEIAQKISVGAIKFADLLPNRTTDYIFDKNKFTDLNGKTGPYMQYSVVRINSLFNKAKNSNIDYKKYNVISTPEERNIIIHLMGLYDTLKKAVDTKLLNEVCEFLFKTTSLYNSFYNDNYILNETNKEKQESWLILSSVVLETNKFILEILGIDIPERM